MNTYAKLATRMTLWLALGSVIGAALAVAVAWNGFNVKANDQRKIMTIAVYGVTVSHEPVASDADGIVIKAGWRRTIALGAGTLGGLIGVLLAGNVFLLREIARLQSLPSRGARQPTESARPTLAA